MSLSLSKMMKAPFAAIFFLFLGSNAQFARAQSPLSFNTRIGSDVDAPVSRPDGTGAGEGYRAGLFVVNGTTITPLLPFTIFRTNPPAAAFYVKAPDLPLIVPGTKQGDKVTLRLRAWHGEDYVKADIRGESKEFVVTLSGNGGLPVELRGLQGFT